MTLSNLAALIGSIAAIVSSLVWIIKQFRGSQEQANQDIEKKVAEEKDAIEKGGRPKWDI